MDGCQLFISPSQRRPHNLEDWHRHCPRQVSEIVAVIGRSAPLRMPGMTPQFRCKPNKNPNKENDNEDNQELSK